MRPARAVISGLPGVRWRF